MSAVDAMPAFAGLVTRFEQEVAGLEQQKTAANQNLKALEETQKELQGRVAVLMAELKMTEGKVAEAQEHARQITANAERQAFGIVKAAQMDAEVLREKGRVAIAAAQAAFARLD
jgi:predicted  nucleic acid-binding Zn-ribbon protein